MKWSLILAEELVREIAGPESLRLLRLIFTKENLNEFELADNLKVNINQARHCLYELQKYNLISSTRKKDKQKGWYVYYWTFDHKKARDLLLKLKQQRLDKLRKEVSREKSGNYLTCLQDGTVVSANDAMETNFRCPVCEEMLIYKRDEKRIKTKDQEIENIQNLIEEGIEIPEPPKKRRKKTTKKKTKRKPAKRTRKKATKKRKPAKRTRKKSKPKRKPAKRRAKRKPAARKRKPAKKTPTRRRKR